MKTFSVFKKNLGKNHMKLDRKNSDKNLFKR
jgi:hypothetical protein